MPSHFQNSTLQPEALWTNAPNKFRPSVFLLDNRVSQKRIPTIKQDRHFLGRVQNRRKKLTLPTPSSKTTPKLLFKLREKEPLAINEAYIWANKNKWKLKIWSENKSSLKWVISFSIISPIAQQTILLSQTSIQLGWIKAYVSNRGNGQQITLPSKPYLLYASSISSSKKTITKYH
ncbi:hypothetical protein AVEN_216141-1 [Araneus ventricosus]|uniref:Uncharacterized protein n=1 Tax=Araneus ventricosus TaxID=182803 RepID=A0A4Y2ME48_ARAVE|nr:hypothetical protein AVEN_216141-1 [Araneus ventricosus]